MPRRRQRGCRHGGSCRRGGSWCQTRRAQGLDMRVKHVSMTQKEIRVRTVSVDRACEAVPEKVADEARKAVNGVLIERVLVNDNVLEAHLAGERELLQQDRQAVGAADVKLASAAGPQRTKADDLSARASASTSRHGKAHLWPLVHHGDFAVAIRVLLLQHLQPRRVHVDEELACLVGIWLTCRVSNERQIGENAPIEKRRRAYMSCSTEGGKLGTYRHRGDQHKGMLSPRKGAPRATTAGCHFHGIALLEITAATEPRNAEAYTI